MIFNAWDSIRDFFSPTGPTPTNVIGNALEQADFVGMAMGVVAVVAPVAIGVFVVRRAFTMSMRLVSSFVR